MSLFLLLAACSDQSGGSLRLEALSADNADAPSQERLAYAGIAAISGADRDWSIGVGISDGSTETVALHAPGASDLSFLDGRDVTVTLGEVWGSNPRDVGITDGEELAFVAQVQESGFATELFGDDFVRYGDEVTVGVIHHEYGDFGISSRDVIFTTDSGEVVASAGEPIDATVDGARWRIVVHAAFQVTEYPDEMPGCGGGVSDTLSFEMVRVAEAPSVTLVEPLEALPLSGEYSCE